MAGGLIKLALIMGYSVFAMAATSSNKCTWSSPQSSGESAMCDLNWSYFYNEKISPGITSVPYFQMAYYSSSSGCASASSESACSAVSKTLCSWISSSKTCAISTSSTVYKKYISAISSYSTVSEKCSAIKSSSKSKCVNDCSWSGSECTVSISGLMGAFCPGQVDTCMSIYSTVGQANCESLSQKECTSGAPPPKPMTVTATQSSTTCKFSNSCDTKCYNKFALTFVGAPSTSTPITIPKVSNCKCPTAKYTKFVDADNQEITFSDKSVFSASSTSQTSVSFSVKLYGKTKCKSTYSVSIS